MNNPDADPVAAGLAESNSHKTAHSISHDLFHFTQFYYYNLGAYVGDGPMGVATFDNGRVWVIPSIIITDIDQIGQDGILSPSHYLDFPPTISNVAPDSARSFISDLSHPILFGAPSSSQPDGVDPRLFQFDAESIMSPLSSNGSTPLYSDLISPYTINPALSADINALGSISTLLGGEDPEVESEQSFLLEKPSRFLWDFHPTNSPPVGEEGEEEVGSFASSAEQAQMSSSPLIGNVAPSTLAMKGEGSEPYDSGHEVDAVSAPTDDLPCPGLAGRNQAETKAELAELLKMADDEGAEARKQGLGKITQSGDTSKCIECGKTARRDRLLAHVVYKHLDLKTWACPLCRKGYTTRDSLARHLKATKVACLCAKGITSNNWYRHSRTCNACLTVAGGLKIEKGRIVVTQSAVLQAEPIRTTQQAAELAPASVPAPAPTFRRSKRLQGRPPSPPPPEAPPRARAPARLQPIIPPPAPVPPVRAPRYWRPTITTFRVREPLPMWPLMHRQHWDWVIPAYNTGYERQDLADTTNLQHTLWDSHYPLAPAALVEVIPNTLWGHQPTVEEGFLWDMI